MIKDQFGPVNGRFGSSSRKNWNAIINLPLIAITQQNNLIYLHSSLHFPDIFHIITASYTIDGQDNRIPFYVYKRGSTFQKSSYMVTRLHCETVTKCYFSRKKFQVNKSLKTSFRIVLPTKHVTSMRFLTILESLLPSVPWMSLSLTERPFSSMSSRPVVSWSKRWSSSAKNNFSFLHYLQLSSSDLYVNTPSKR